MNKHTHDEQIEKDERELVPAGANSASREEEDDDSTLSVKAIKQSNTSDDKARVDKAPVQEALVEKPVVEDTPVEKPVEDALIETPPVDEPQTLRSISRSLAALRRQTPIPATPFVEHFCEFHWIYWFGYIAVHPCCKTFFTIT